MTVAEVKYENQLPWPANANAGGVSLQLVDPRQDNWRVGNWMAVAPNTPRMPQWTYVTATGTASSSTFYIYLQSAGDVYVDDLKLVAGSVPEAGVNRLSNGGFEAPLAGTWTVSANLANSVISTATRHSGYCQPARDFHGRRHDAKQLYLADDFPGADVRRDLHAELLVSAEYQRRTADASVVGFGHCCHGESECAVGRARHRQRRTP